ncbi:MAG: alpha/beta hydrolase [Herpetosiphonaceae bacterium]|nr:alpha/beta hydrolase [Herpetosiphonaceae bacterium]
MPVVDSTAGPIWYLQRGNGVPLVMVHGAGGTARHWGYQLSGLKESASALALDLPGHGRSPGPPPRTISDAGKLLLQWMDALHLPQAVLMGHSMGGAIVQWLALNAPERLLGLILVATGARLRVAPTILEGISQDFAATTQLITQLSYRPATPPAIIAQAVAELRTMPPAVLHNDYAACDAWDAMTRVSAITVPTLILVGEQDRMTPLKYSQWLHERIAGSQLVIIPAAGHMVMVEQADIVNRTIGAWLSAVILPTIRYNSSGN